MKRRATISRVMTAIRWLDDDRQFYFPLTVEWRKEDPAVIHLSSRDVMWEIARDHWVQAAVHNEDAGMEDGDVFIQPAEDTTFGHVLLHHLSNEYEHIHVILPTSSVFRFVGDTILEVPIGKEDYSKMVDEALKVFLG